MSERNEFAVRLKAWRQALDLTQEQVAWRVDKTSATICNWELGRSTPTIRVAATVAAKLGLTNLATLFGPTPQERWAKCQCLPSIEPPAADTGAPT